MSTIIPYAPIPEGEYNIFVRQIGVKKAVVHVQSLEIMLRSPFVDI